MPFALDESTRWEQGQSSALLVPLLGKQHIIGGLSALGKRNGGSFTRADLDLLTLFANQVSVAIENASLVTQLRETLEHLEQRVEERTTELRTTNQELESFCYSASHDLRTPLRGIDGFSHILLEDYHSLLDDRGREYLQRIRAASQLMGKLIDDMLRLSRVSRCKLRLTQTDLSPIVARIVARRRQDAPQRDIDVHIESHLVCTGDEGLLVIALENLISNAWKFTARSPRPRIEVGRQSGDHSAFFVRDNGCGFNTRYGDKLFKPFERLHNERDYPGTGVGLAIVERIIRRHGGNIRAECDDGATTFYFSLPSGSGQSA
jgi:light-regulated signal transduction histidine kinase (bacteriophytochrome)